MSPPPAEFSPSPCYSDDTGDERECTEAELAQQRKDFDTAQAESKGETGMAASAMGGEMGGLGSDESIAELVEQLKKQRGWNKVSYRGNRIIDVEYAITGNSAHGFAFPLVDGGNAIMPFVTIIARKDGSVKVSAPAYSGEAGGGDMAALGAMLASDVAMHSDGGGKRLRWSGRSSAAVWCCSCTRRWRCCSASKPRSWWACGSSMACPASSPGRAMASCRPRRWRSRTNGSSASM